MRRAGKIKNILENEYRFEKFALLIDSIHKGISRVKQDVVLNTSVKSVHTMWLYKLFRYPDGLTATELASESMIDRSLISRELANLAKDGYITIESAGKKRSYNSRIKLTESGKQVARKIVEGASQVQLAVGEGVSDEELVSFYSTLEKFHNNFEKLQGDRKET